LLIATKALIIIAAVSSGSVSVSFRSYYDSGVCDLRGGGGEENGNSITLTGLLNFNDGLWSCCGSERIFVFTTNHIEKLDPALLRSGRMDMHIF
jgi:chaperone BCS1